MSVKRKFRHILIPALALLPFAAGAQSGVQLSPQGWVERGAWMLENGNFSGAADQLQRYDALCAVEGLEPESSSAFMLARALYERQDPRCVDALRKFLEINPASAYAPQARMLIADYYFFSGNYGAAAREYSGIDSGSLNAAERATFTYRKALSLLRTGDYTASSALFGNLLKNDTYGYAAGFCLAYIDYAEGRLDVAEYKFRNLQLDHRAGRKSADDLFPTRADASYYLAQIDFRLGRYEDAASAASRLARTATDPMIAAEMQRVAGESRFKLGEYSEAAPALSAYLATPGIDHALSACYALGAIQYSEGNCDAAEALFARCLDSRDAIAQGAYLYSGQISARRGDMSAAAIAFEKAYRMGFDRKVSETALYDYVAARTDGGRVPFGSSVDMLEDFLRSFPKSKYAPQVDRYLAGAYYSEGEYSKALASIERVPQQTDEVRATRQKILYSLGVEALSNSRPQECARYMEQAVAINNADRALALQARLWLADARYNMGEYRAAATDYETFLKSARTDTPNRALARYNLAYALYMQNRFGDAARRFNEAVSDASADPGLRADALLRKADCLYYNGRHREALEVYSEAMRSGSDAADYASLQRARMFGLAGDNKSKLAGLDAMIRDYPRSAWIPAAMLERAQTLVGTGRTADALAAFDSLIKHYPDASETRRGLLQMAITYSNSGRKAEGERAYRQVISRWPSSEEAQAANEDLRAIYASRGELAEYQAFLRSVPDAPQLDSDQMEKLTYEAADDAISADRPDASGMKAYLRDFPDGRYLAAALYSLADHEYSAGNRDTALKYVSELLSRRPDSQYVPDALSLKGEILCATPGTSPAEIRKIYNELARKGGADYAAESTLGLMRVEADNDRRINYARRLLEMNGTTSDEREEATYTLASALEQTGRRSEAEKLYIALSSNVKTLHGAKAAVALGELYLSEKRYADARSSLERFTDEGTPHQYWLARGFIALADALHASGRKTAATEYIRSLRDNYPGEEIDIKDMINQRLKKWK